MTAQTTAQPKFLISTSAPCPYLDGRSERKVFTLLPMDDDGALHDALAQSGFRRSQSYAYKPACGGCNACISVRIRAADFRWSKRFRRIAARNADITADVLPAQASEERFDLFRRYLRARHDDGDMVAMGYDEFTTMMETSPVDTRVVDYRDAEGRLMACALVDRVGDGWSLVYSFYDPEAARRSLGVHVIIDHVVRTAAEGDAYVYLGYWVAGGAKMDYKRDFAPLEAYLYGRWVTLAPYKPGVKPYPSWAEVTRARGTRVIGF